MRCWGGGIDQATAKAAADAALADAASIPLTPALFFAGCVAASALLAGRQLKAWRSQKTQSECAPLLTSQPTRRFRLLRAGLRGRAEAAPGSFAAKPSGAYGAQRPAPTVSVSLEGRIQNATSLRD